jgi:hypothetical protein
MVMLDSRDEHARLFDQQLPRGGTAAGLCCERFGTTRRRRSNQLEFGPFFATLSLSVCPLLASRWRNAQRRWWIALRPIAAAG